MRKNRDTVVTVRFTKDEAAAIRDLAELKDQTMSAYVRACVMAMSTARPVHYRASEGYTGPIPPVDAWYYIPTQSF